ncbi:unnamed protein product [Rotaria magnacalcarata]|uniref:SH3 domain-containing protein n=3 Tax=Rotaria magnacalcarata TaxID=392030 RepID=A0A819FCJ9_9BILA|nr:unnamed protein product [Rotaria magnacalcarata]CAF1662064.1 unnamed protein product [Rotaria magnacalcarata]CAF2035114.1 unnamed protein product [Rotaria magnacalcarata]CAF2131713.1 unnamed protein product [Rotaria magnacalcarata]CAF2267823.1 unnamed protein product [Rotaria magnacalcarata]
MFLKLLVNVFERAKSKITSTHSINRIPSESDNEFDPNNSKQSSPYVPSIIHQQPRSSLSKWLCTTTATANKSIVSSKSNKVRRSTSWRSLKERGNNYIEHITSRALSVDEIHQNDKKYKQNTSIRKEKYNRRDPSHSPSTDSTHQCQRKAGLNRIRLSNCDASTSLPTNHNHFYGSSSTCVNYADRNKKQNLSTKSHRRNNREKFSTNKINSVGGDSGYSEESFSTTISSYTRPLHTSCPHCHCENRSSFNNYKKSRGSSLTDSPTSDTTINKQIHSSDFYYHLLQHKQILSASRSYPHIKPLPKTMLRSQTIKPSIKQQQRHNRPYGSKRRRHLSCDSSLWSRTQTQQPIQQRASPVVSEPNHAIRQRHFTTIGMMHDDPSLTYSKTLSTLPNMKPVGDELNLAAIELDSLRTLECYRTSFSSSYSSSLTSSSCSLNTDKQLKQPRSHPKKSSRQKGTYLVWHEYKNSSLLSATNGAKIFSVIRGDQVRLLRRIGKSTLLVKKEEDGSIGFLPQSCLAHDEINSFLSVKGLKETVL